MEFDVRDSTLLPLPLQMVDHSANPFRSITCQIKTRLCVLSFHLCYHLLIYTVDRTHGPHGQLELMNRLERLFGEIGQGRIGHGVVKNRQASW